MSHRVPAISKCRGAGDHPGYFQQYICLSILGPLRVLPGFMASQSVHCVHHIVSDANSKLFDIVEFLLEGGHSFRGRALDSTHISRTLFR